MKHVILVAMLMLLIVSPAFAVDVTITLTAGQATRFAAVCGVAKQLGRACTLIESKAFVIERLRQVVIDYEGSMANKAATDAVVIPAFDPS